MNISKIESVYLRSIVNEGVNVEDLYEGVEVEQRDFEYDGLNSPVKVVVTVYSNKVDEEDAEPEKFGYVATWYEGDDVEGENILSETFKFNSVEETFKSAKESVDYYYEKEYGEAVRYYKNNKNNNSLMF